MTTRFTTSRSRVHQLLLAAAGVLLLLAAIDIVSLHKLSDPPSTNDDGVLTSKGQTERRTDMIWGSIFTAVGGSLIVVGLGGLMTGRPVVEIDDEVLSLRVAGPMSMLDFPWHDIVSVRSGRDREDDGRVPTPVLLVEVDEPGKYPKELWGAVWEGPVLQVDAGGWAAAVEDVAVRCQLMLDRPQEGEG